MPFAPAFVVAIVPLDLPSFAAVTWAVYSAFLATSARPLTSLAVCIAYCVASAMDSCAFKACADNVSSNCLAVLDCSSRSHAACCRARSLATRASSAATLACVCCDSAYSNLASRLLDADKVRCRVAWTCAVVSTSDNTCAVAVFRHHSPGTASRLAPHCVGMTHPLVRMTLPQTLVLSLRGSVHPQVLFAWSPLPWTLLPAHSSRGLPLRPVTPDCNKFRNRWTSHLSGWSTRCNGSRGLARSALFTSNTRGCDWGVHTAL